MTKTNIGLALAAAVVMITALVLLGTSGLVSPGVLVALLSIGAGAALAALVFAIVSAATRQLERCWAKIGDPLDSFFERY